MSCSPPEPLQLLVFGGGDVDEAERVIALLAELDEWVLGVGVLGMALGPGRRVLWLAKDVCDVEPGEPEIWFWPLSTFSVEGSAVAVAAFSTAATPVVVALGIAAPVVGLLELANASGGWWTRFVGCNMQVVRGGW